MRRHFLRVALALTLLASPMGTSGAGNVPALDEPRVTVDDVVAGFETTVRYSGAPRETVDLHVVSPAGEDTVVPVTTDGAGMAVTTIPPALLTDVGLYRAFAVSGQRKLTADATFEVLSDRVDPRWSRLSVDRPVLASDGRSSVTVTVMLLDARGNPLPGRPVRLVGSRAEDRITPLAGTEETDREGRSAFAVQTQTPGEIALRAMDLLSGTMLEQVAHVSARQNTAVGGFEPRSFVNDVTPAARAAPLRAQLGESGIPATPDVLDHFGITVSTPAVNVGDVIPLVSVTALDRKNTPVESFTGEVTISASDPNATLPINRTLSFTGNRRGTYDIHWLISFKKAGAQTLVVTDASGTVRGEATVTVGGTRTIAENRRIRMETPQDGDTVNAGEILLKGKGPALRNLNVWIADGAAATDTLTDNENNVTARGETDAAGAFSFTARLPAGVDAAILQIRDDAAEYDSGVLHLTIDANGPKLDYTFTPDRPHEGDDVTLDVNSEPGLPEVTLRIREQDISLTESDPGTYQVLFAAPAAGAVGYTLTARDSIGNVTDVRGTLTVKGPILPQVQNVRADPLAGGIQLSWDMIPDDTITGYRIDVGTSPGRTDFFLDTPEPTSSAAVMGRSLKAGIDYFLTVSALRGQDPGPKSATVAARTLGMELTAIPGEGNLLLQWTFPDTTPLSSFLLAYGSPEGEYSEERTLDGGMRAYTLGDLLAQPYLLRLTPVTTTGEILHELTVTTEATPLRATAFRPSGDSVRVNPDDRAPGNALHASAPATPGSGLPGLSWKLILALTAIPAVWYWHRRRKAVREAQAFLAIVQRKYHSL